MAATPSPARSQLRSSLAAAAIVLAAIAVYANSLKGPFLFDDQAAIVHNASIRHLGDLGAVLSPPSGNGITVDGRPGLNFSLAVNYAISGTNGWSYHAVNLLIHVLAGLTLFGIVRRTVLACKALHPTLLAFAVALLWVVHPLQTESVTYVIQRAESLMGLFYLLTLYCFIRGATHSTPVGGDSLWLSLSVLACFFGMTTKEVMVSAPLVVLLYDRTFISAGFRDALRWRWRYYSLLALAGAVLLGLALKTGTRGGTAGFGIDVGPGKYWPTQFQALVHYLWLSFWPLHLIFDYGVQWTKGLAEIVPYALLVGALAIATVIALWRRRAAGFLGACFFVILAPTSLVPGNRQTLAEHRMYLPLAAIIAWVVCGAYALVPAARRRQVWVPGGLLLLAVVAALGGLTVRRNEIYQSEITLYRDTVAKRPGNASAHLNLGNFLRDARRYDDAVAQYGEALQLRPDYYQAQYNLGIALADSDRLAQAILHYEEALRLKPDYPEAQNNLGIALSRAGREAEAIGHLTEAVRLNPRYVEAHYNLGLVLARTGNLTEAVAEFQQTLRLNPAFPSAHTTLGYALQILGRNAEAADQFQAAAALRPQPPETGER